MKQSDVFAVPIDTDDSRLLNSKTEHRDMEEDLLGSKFVPSSSAMPFCTYLLSQCSQLFRPYRYNEVVFFKVTNIEYDLMAKPDSFQPDFYRSSTLGELGCWVDSSITRIIQAGLENSRVPDSRSYMLGRCGLFLKFKELNSFQIHLVVCFHINLTPSTLGAHFPNCYR